MRGQKTTSVSLNVLHFLWAKNELSDEKLLALGFKNISTNSYGLLNKTPILVVCDEKSIWSCAVGDKIILHDYTFENNETAFDVLNRIKSFRLAIEIG